MQDTANAAGIGAFFNLMNFGQMLLWHVVLLPLILVGIVGTHILLVRYRGVVHPFPARRGCDPLGQPLGAAPPPRRGEPRAADAAEWRGPVRRYDLMREAVAATAVVATATPADFVQTAAAELAGTAFTATYGPPYNRGTAAVQGLGLSWQTLAGVQDPIHPARMFIADHLRATAGHDRTLQDALATWRAAPARQRSAWAQAYASAAAKVRFTRSGAPVVPAGRYGPVPVLMVATLTLAQDGGLDASLLAGRVFYGTDFNSARQAGCQTRRVSPQR